MRRVRIVNTDGVGKHTIITDADTGESIDSVTHVEVNFGVNDFVTAKLTYVLPKLDIIAEANDPFSDMGTCPSCHRAEGTAEVHQCPSHLHRPS